MYKQWPLGQLPPELQRPELNQLKDRGYSFGNPTEVVDIFEKKVADFCGSKFAVAVDCCSNAIFLILKYINNPQKVKIPYFTYASVPMQILHAGYEFEFVDKKWSGTYKLDPLDVWDFAGRWTKGMYEGGYAALSFQIKKRLPIYTKTEKSKSQYCAGYYLLLLNNIWTKTFCPKSISVNRYQYLGPFKTETEMKAALASVNKE